MPATSSGHCSSFTKAAAGWHASLHIPNLAMPALKMCYGVCMHVLRDGRREEVVGMGVSKQRGWNHFFSLLTRGLGAAHQRAGETIGLCAREQTIEHGAGPHFIVDFEYMTASLPASIMSVNSSKSMRPSPAAGTTHRTWRCASSPALHATCPERRTE